MGNNNGEDTVYCLDAVNGTLIWKYSYPCVLDPRFYEGPRDGEEGNDSTENYVNTVALSEEPESVGV